jgi:2'-5' RNA ligase
MSVFRAFIALNMNDEVRERIDHVSRELQEKLDGLPVRWVPVENIHLTLKFLGDVSVANQDMLAEQLEQTAALNQEFAFSVGELGVFPNWKRLRVIWLGIEGPGELQNLQRSIDVESARIGYPSDDRPFSPHLTLGRVSRNAGPDDIRAIARVLKAESIGFLGVVPVREVHMYKSELQPGGAVYTPLASADLKKKS